MSSNSFPQSSASDHAAAVTFWFATVAEPKQVLANDPKVDRGFGRKFLAQFNPTLPVTHLGDFPLNRSATVGAAEIYVAGYNGLAVLQVRLDDPRHLSTVDPRLLEQISATDVFAFHSEPDTRHAGYAHWRAGKLVRSLCMSQTKIYEDIGIPGGFEGPFWAGKRGGDRGGISLPFDPVDLVAEAQVHWLGFDPAANEFDIPVAGFAVDGRKPPRTSAVDFAAEYQRAHTEDQEDTADSYDDYEVADSDVDGDAMHKVKDAAKTSWSATERVLRVAGSGLNRARRAVWNQLQKRNRS
ncbi:DUF6928 family protein [Corynebacterium ulceribovis]|uniref:DUF6928 family protein n=1 Tax=Corynebacterium ulceribovis TaxID=487732 RepID=UPI000371CF49|nr:hypothetical protein [Corynebacterium ulceribovis]